MDNKNLKTILKRHHDFTKETAETIYQELKNRSNDYGELKRNICISKKSIFYEQANIVKFEGLFKEVEKMLEKEMNGLPLTNRSTD